MGWDGGGKNAATRDRGPAVGELAYPRPGAGLGRGAVLVAVVLRVLDDGSDPLVDEGHRPMQCRRGSLPVLDMFGGTGTTAHAGLNMAETHPD